MQRTSSKSKKKLTREQNKEDQDLTLVRGVLYKPLALLRVCRAKIESRSNSGKQDDAF